MCGHSYSKDAIKTWIQTELRNRGTVQCPVAGCEASLNERGLIRDTDMEHELLRVQLRPTPEELAEEQAGSAGTHTQRDEEVYDL